jgi:peptidoglycan hydrolase CwlO-like protein
MTRTALAARRGTTLVAILVAVAIGLLAIRVAAAWAATSAPLTVSPVAVETLRGQLEVERARSEQLLAELGRLSSQSSELRTALDAANGRIADDSEHAADLAKDLDTAQKKLAKLEKEIRRARAALANQPQTTVTTVQTAATQQSGGEHEDHDDHEDEEEHDDD